MKKYILSIILAFICTLAMNAQQFQVVKDGSVIKTWTINQVDNVQIVDIEGEPIIQLTFKGDIVAEYTRAQADKVVVAEGVKVTNLLMDSNGIDMVVGTNATINVGFIPQDASDRRLVWTSSDPTVAMVSQKGQVAALKLGTATIRATADDGSGVYTECVVFVVENTEELVRVHPSSVSVDGVNNSIFGMIKTSAGIQTNMLFGFYGEFDDVKFPSTNVADYGDNSVILDGSNVTINSETVKGGTVYSKDLGTVYYTINPTQVDFTGVKMYLYNSLGEKTGVTLSDAAKSEQALKMGWTRKSRAIGKTYESTATVNDINNIEKIELNGKKYVDAITAFQSSDYTSAITSLATAVKSTLSAFQTDAYALSSSDNSGYIVNSDLDIQAALIKPVSYATTAPVATSAQWSKSKALDITNKVIEKVFDKMKSEVSLDDLKTTLEALQNAQHIVFSLDGVNIKVDVGKIPAEFEVDPFSGNVTVTKWEEKGTTLTETELESLANALNLSVSSTNDMIDQLNAACAQGIAIINKLTGADLQNTMSSAIEGVIDEAWEKLDSIYGSVEYRYELALFVEDGDNVIFPSSTLVKAPKVGSDITLRLSNMNLEMITPAYKKHVVCTWASDATEVANINSSNESLNKVLDGTTRTISVSGLKSGVTYAFSYSGLDYAGKQETRVFYVTGE